MNRIGICLLTIFIFVGFLGCEKKEVLSQDALKEKGFVTDPIPDLPLDKIQLPEGFKIEIFAAVHNPRSIALSESGIVYVGNRSGDKVYALVDEDGDFVADRKYIVDEGLRSPNGVAFKDGDLYVADISKILKYENIEEHLENPPNPVVVYDEYPTEGHHGWKYISFGPDGKLYVPVGAPCNICERTDNEIFASITRIELGSAPEIFARGVRNSVGFTWHPETNEMWFTDNGRDMLGDDIPPCELNHAPKPGMHFGYPYCHGESIQDPEFGDRGQCADFISPVQSLGPHTAPLGVKFYTGNQFPVEFKHELFIAEHGSWNRSQKIGYRIMRVSLDGNISKGYEVFATGWLNETTQSHWGRPVDIMELSDGSLLVSDDYADVIYRITHDG